MAEYDVPQCVNLVMMYAYEGALLAIVAQRFHLKYPNAPVPTWSIIHNIVKKLKKTCLVLDKKHIGRPRSRANYDSATSLGNVLSQPNQIAAQSISRMWN